MGRYGISRNTVEEITKEDCAKIMVETTKLIEAKKDAKEVAIAFYDRAWVYDERHEYDKAILDLTSAIKIAPEFASAYYNRGFSYWKINQFAEALGDFNKALQFYTKNNGTPEQIRKTKNWIKKLENNMFIEREKLIRQK